MVADLLTLQRLVAEARVRGFEIQRLDYRSDRTSGRSDVVLDISFSGPEGAGERATRYFSRLVGVCSVKLG